jgi:hypothetical protein
MSDYFSIAVQAAPIVVPVCTFIAACAHWLARKLSHIEQIPILIEAFNEFKTESTNDFNLLSNRVGQVERDLKEALDVRKEVIKLEARILLLEGSGGHK